MFLNARRPAVPTLCVNWIPELRFVYCARIEDYPVLMVAMQLTITARPTDYEMLYESVVPRRGSATVTQSCVLNGPSPSFTQAVCSLSAWFAVGGRSAQLTSTVETVAQTDIPAKATLPVTAGATNIASTCASNPSTTSSTTTSNQMAPTVGGTQTSVDAAPTAAVYKVLIPIGAAAMGLVLL